MTYGGFLCLFLVLPLAGLVFGMRRHLSLPLLLTLAVVSVVALVYTGPWDNLIIVNGVWSYAPHQIAGLVIGHVPLEEYVFYVLQVFLTGLFAAAVLRREQR